MWYTSGDSRDDVQWVNNATQSHTKSTRNSEYVCARNIFGKQLKGISESKTKWLSFLWGAIHNTRNSIVRAFATRLKDNRGFHRRGIAKCKWSMLSGRCSQFFDLISTNVDGLCHSIYSFIFILSKFLLPLLYISHY